MRRRLCVIALCVALAAQVLCVDTARAQKPADWSPAAISLIIAQSAGEFGVSAYWMGRVLWCESAWQPGAYNASSGAAGIAQFIPSTFYGWVYRLGWLPGTWISAYNPAVAIRTMAYIWSQGGAGMWSCSYIVGYMR